MMKSELDKDSAEETIVSLMAFTVYHCSQSLPLPSPTAKVPHNGGDQEGGAASHKSQFVLVTILDRRERHATMYCDCITIEHRTCDM